MSDLRMEIPLERDESTKLKKLTTSQEWEGAFVLYITRLRKHLMEKMADPRTGEYDTNVLKGECKRLKKLLALKDDLPKY